MINREAKKEYNKIPKYIHRSVWHSVFNNINMDIINKKAFDFIGNTLIVQAC